MKKQILNGIFECRSDQICVYYSSNKNASFQNNHIPKVGPPREQNQIKQKWLSSAFQNVLFNALFHIFIESTINFVFLQKKLRVS